MNHKGSNISRSWRNRQGWMIIGVFGTGLLLIAFAFWAGFHHY